MIIKDKKVIFEKSDMHFVKKFGPIDAANMVQDFRLHKKTPFVYDTYQLAFLLRVGRKSLFSILKNIDEQYRSVTIKKKNGKDRILSVPRHSLKHIQSVILRRILSEIPVSEYAKAYKKGTSLIDNASPHIGKKYLLKIDITDFFGSIYFDQVYKAAFNRNFFPIQIGTILTTLCTKNDTLPQGASTSPALSNLVMKNFDDNIGSWCKKRDISYTRYCDDMTFSSDKPLYTVYTKVSKMLEDMGFEVNAKKTHFVTNSSRQSVTGLTVNEKMSVSSDYKRKLRQEVHYALEFGFSDALSHVGNPNITSAEQYRNHLVGKIKYVLQIEPQNHWFIDALYRMDYVK